MVEVVVESVEPSPNVQAYVKGAVPPVTDAVNVTACPATGVDGLHEKLTPRPGGGELLSFHAVSGCNSQPENWWPELRPPLSQ